jgi:hypothetical protein
LSAVAGLLFDGEVLEEVVGYHMALPSERSRAILPGIVAKNRWPARRLLQSLPHLSDAPTAAPGPGQHAEWWEPAPEE